MTDALAAAIEGEQAAVYAYGLAGPHLSGAARDLALGGLAAHRARVSLLRETANDAAEPGIPLGYAVTPITDEAGARTLLGEVESRLAAVYADLASATTGSDRIDAVLGARECAIRSVAWGAAPEAFPGQATKPGA